MSVIDPSKKGETAAHIPLCVPEIRGNEWEYIKECLDTNWVSSAGSYVDRFEREFADYVGADHAVACVNGTAALHVALEIAGVESGDAVLTSTLTFIAPANAVRYCGGWPIFVDAEEGHLQLDASKLRNFLDQRCEESNGELVDAETGRRIAALLPVHILGHPVDLEPVLELGEEYNLPVIEDASESLGALYRGEPVGVLGDMGCFSFNGNKMITTGGGGMLVTDNSEWAERARYLTTQAKDDPVEYIHREIGYNYRLTNLQAAMGCAQLEQLDEYVAKKRRIAERYGEGLGDVPGIEPMYEAEWARSSAWLYTIRIEAESFGMSRHVLTDTLSDAGIESRPLWQPLHESPAHESRCVGGGRIAERVKADALCLPCSVGLTPEQQQKVIREIRKAGEA